MSSKDDDMQISKPIHFCTSGHAGQYATNAKIPTSIVINIEGFQVIKESCIILVLVIYYYITI